MGPKKPSKGHNEAAIGQERTAPARQISRAVTASAVPGLAAPSDATSGMGQPERAIDDALFRVKLSPPRAHHQAVQRLRLREVLVGKSAKLTIVRAPAGFGKTTLLQQWREWLASERIACAWLTLDAADNDPERLIAALDAAVKSQAVQPTARATDLLPSMPGLIERLERNSSRLILILDDVDKIDAPEARSVLQMLLRNTPPSVQMVLAGRSIPSVGQARLRLAEDVTDLDIDDLRFRLDEVSAFFSRRLAQPLTSTQIQDLYRHTEGWPAALQLASLSIRDEPAGVRSFSPLVAMSSSIAEYLQEDVLDRQPTDVRDFLLKISVLRLITGSLCDAITGRRDGEAMLARLEADGLFLTRATADHGLVWYRFHSLFGEFLQRQLQFVGAAQVAALHEAASDWFSAHEMPAEAAEHARLGGHDERALSILNMIAMEHVWQGRLRTVLDWSVGLTVDHAARYEQLFGAYLWAEGFIGDGGRALRRLADLTERAHTLPSRSNYLSDTLICLPILIAGAQHDLETLTREGPEALAKLTNAETFEYGTVANCVAFGYMSVGKLDEARRTLGLAQAACRTPSRLYNFVHTQLELGLLHMCELDIERALAATRHGYERAAAAVSELSHATAIAATFYADILCEIGEFDQARTLLERHLPLIADTIPDCFVTGYSAAVKLALYDGDMDRAREIIFDAQAHGLRRASRPIQHFAKLAGAWVCALDDNLNEARQHLEECLSFDAPLTERLLSPVDALVQDLYPLRVRLYCGDPVDMAELEGLIADAMVKRSGRRLLQLSILRAIALSRNGDASGAVEAMVTALKHGLTRGSVLAFLAEGPLGIDLVREARTHITGHCSVARLARLDEMLSACPYSASSAVPPKLPVPASLREALTGREIDILGIVEKGLTNREIAECFGLSESTVKWHLRNIFDKLGVGNRTEAVFLLRTED